MQTMYHRHYEQYDGKEEDAYYDCDQYDDYDWDPKANRMRVTTFHTRISSS